MRATTVRDLGALARAERRARGMTQAELAERLGVSRDWVVRLEQGHPRLEAQRVLDALAVLGLSLDVRDNGSRRVASRKVPNVTSTATKNAATKHTTTKTHTKKTTSNSGRATKATTGRFTSATTAKKAPAKKTVATNRTNAKRDPFDALFQGR